MTTPRLIEDQITGSSFSRTVWLQSPAGASATHAVIFLDAEIFIERVNAPAVIAELQVAGRIPPTLAVYISHNGAAARHADFTCNLDYAVFIAQVVRPWVLAKQATVEPSSCVLTGLSLSGLAALHAAVRFSNHFASLIAQSPSMWWEQERFARLLEPVEGPRPRVWISVGDQETETDVKHPPSGLHQQTSQIDSCGRACEAFRAAGYDTHDRVFHGGHDCECWREDLAQALPWALR